MLLPREISRRGRIVLDSVRESQVLGSVGLPF